MGVQGEVTNQTTLIFTYGTLKRGFSNHILLQNLITTGDAAFIGTCRTSLSYPLVCGPYRVPFLLNFPGSGQLVHGELYSVSTQGLAALDDLEGINRCHYKRAPIKVQLSDADEEELICAEAYYAHDSYAMEMWRKNGELGLCIYSEKEAKGYVSRKDRPINLTFLDHIRMFVSSGN